MDLKSRYLKSKFKFKFFKCNLKSERQKTSNLELGNHAYMYKRKPRPNLLASSIQNITCQRSKASHAYRYLCSRHVKKVVATTMHVCAAIKMCSKHKFIENLFN